MDNEQRFGHFVGSAANGHVMIQTAGQPATKIPLNLEVTLEPSTHLNLNTCKL